MPGGLRLKYKVVHTDEARSDLLDLRASDRAKMKQVPLKKAKDDLSHYVALSATEDIVITKHGMPAAILIGIANADDLWEKLLLRDPAFKQRIAAARQSAREGRVHTLDDIEAELGLPRKRRSAAKKKPTRAIGKKPSHKKRVVQTA